MLNNHIFSSKFCEQKKQGFTLIEVLLAAAFSFVVISAAGWGLVNLLQANVDSENKSLSQENLNRALDFIADEVRTAISINKLSAPTSSNFGSGAIVSGTEQIILILEIPELGTEPVVYRIAEPSNSKPWLKPRAIYRWGPNFKADGSYSDPTDTSNWKNYVLIDLIEEQATTPNCETNWTQSPTTTPRGFYACIDPNEKIADIHILGRVASASQPYEISVRTFARSGTP